MDKLVSIQCVVCEELILIPVDVDQYIVEQSKRYKVDVWHGECYLKWAQNQDESKQEKDKIILRVA